MHGARLAHFPPSLSLFSSTVAASPVQEMVEPRPASTPALKDERIFPVSVVIQLANTASSVAFLQKHVVKPILKAGLKFGVIRATDNKSLFCHIFATYGTDAIGLGGTCDGRVGPVPKRKHKLRPLRVRHLRAPLPSPLASPGTTDCSRKLSCAISICH